MAAMESLVRCGFSILLAAFAIAQPGLAYEYPLSPEAIREAYFFGKANPDKKTEFLEKYTHHLPLPKSGPYVAWIEVETPFACVVKKVARMPLNYHAQEAEQDFLGKPGCFHVRVEIDFTPTYPDPRAATAVRSDFWRDFKVHLRQRAEIPPRSVRGQLIYNEKALIGFTGATILLDYDVKRIDPAAPAIIEVVAPDEQHIQTTFDLAGLR
jgi:hypothetical protein